MPRSRRRSRRRRKRLEKERKKERKKQRMNERERRRRRRRRNSDVVLSPREEDITEGEKSVLSIYRKAKERTGGEDEEEQNKRSAGQIEMVEEKQHEAQTGLIKQRKTGNGGEDQCHLGVCMSMYMRRTGSKRA